MPALKRRVSRRARRPAASLTRVRLLKAMTIRPRAARARTPAKSRTARPRGRFVEVDGVRIHYIPRGKGRPVVLIHGNGTMAEDFVVSGLVDRLAAQYRVIAIDRPGFGRTERPRTRLWTPSAQAHLIGRALDRLRVRRPVIVGHSWGALVALALAVGGRDLRGLVLLAGYFYPTTRADTIASAPLAVPGLGDAMRYTASPVVGRMIAQQFIARAFQPRPVPARFRARYPFELASSPEHLRAIAEDAALLPAGAAELQRRYARLTLPVVIMAGEADHVIAANEQSRRLHRDIAGSRIEIVPKAGHMIHYAARGRIGRAVDALMR